jgi:excisionase family DNA binding protein
VAAQPSSNTAADTRNYLRTAEVADILHVSPKTVSRWAKEGKLPFLRTLGGHRRYSAAQIRWPTSCRCGRRPSAVRFLRLVMQQVVPRLAR